MERNTTLWERAAALMLALFMVFSMMPLQAFAEGAEPTVTIKGETIIAVGTQSITLTASPQNMQENAVISYEWSVPQDSAATIASVDGSDKATLTRVEGKGGTVTVTVKATVNAGSEPVVGTQDIVVETKQASLTGVTVKKGDTPVNSDVEVYVGEELTAEAEGEDSDRAVYTWTKDGGTLLTGDTFTPAEAGTYKVVAQVEDLKNGLLASDSTKTITVKKHITELFITKDEVSCESVKLTIDKDNKKPTAQLGVAYNSDISESDKGVKWSSGTQGVATVDENGLVTAQGAGTAIITAKSTVNESCTDTCTITVVETTASSISIQDSNGYEVTAPINLTYGETYQLKSVVTPAEAVGTVEWRSNIDGAVTVDQNGLVKVIKYVPDPVTITAQIGDKSATCTIRPQKKQITITGITFAEKVYDGTTALTPSSITMGPKVEGAVIGGLSYSTTDGDVGVEKTVEINGTPYIEGENKENYDVVLRTGLTAKVTITKKSLKLESLEEQIYNGTSTYEDVSAVVSGFVTGQEPQSFDVTVTGTGKLNAGDNSVTIEWPVSGIDQVNYQWPGSGQLRIKAKELHFTVKPNDKGYDGNPEVKGFTCESAEDSVLVGEDDGQTLSTTLTANMLQFASKGSIEGTPDIDVSLRENETVQVKVGNAVSGNYTAVLHIEKASITTNFYSENTGFRLPNASYTQTEGSVTTRWYKGEKVTLTAETGYEVAAAEDGAYGNTVELVPDSNDNLTVFVRNTADGTLAKETVNHIRVDQDAPVIVTTSAEGDLALSKEAVTYTIAVTDSGSDVRTESIQYYISTSNTEVAGGEWKDGKAEPVANETGEYTFMVQVPASGYLYVKAQDNVGNEAVSGSIRALVLENTVPTVTATCDDADKAKNNHTILWEAYDSSENGTAPYPYSGISSVTYQLKQGDNVVGQGSLVTCDAPSKMEDIPGLRAKGGTLDLGNDLEGTNTLTITATDFCGNSATKSITLEFDHTPATVQVKMNGGNAADGTYYYNKDNCAISITVQDDYLNQGVVYTATLDGLDVEKSGTISSDTQKTKTIELFTAAEVARSGDGMKGLTLTLTDAAGNQTAALQPGIGVNTDSTDRMKATFVLDTTAPVLTEVVSSDQGHYYSDNGSVYYKSAFSVSFKVCEANYDLGNIDTDSFAKPKTQTSALNWTAVAVETEENVTKFTANVTGTADNDSYRPEFTIVDKAGNPMAAQSGLAESGQNGVSVSEGKATTATTFVLDTVAPQLTNVTSTTGNYYSGDKKVYYNNDFTVTFEVDETNYDANCVQLANGNTEVQTGIPEMLLSKNQQNAITVSVARADQVANALYQPQLTVTDKAGNAMVAQTDLAESGQNGVSVSEGKATTATTFVLDTVAPQLTTVSSTGGNYYTGETENKVYYNNDFTVTFVVEETNYDETKVELANAYTENPDSSPVMSLSANSQAAITASVSGKSDNALYQPQLTVTDKAGNKMVEGDDLVPTGRDSVTVSEGKATTAATFVLDTTAPILVSVEGTDATGHAYREGVYYQGGFDATFTIDEINYDASQTGSMGKSELSILEDDTKEIYQKDAGMDVRGDNGVEHTVQAKVSDPNENESVAKTVYSIALTVTDKAGNPLTATEIAPYKSEDDSSQIHTTVDNKGTATLKNRIMDNVAPEVEIEYTALEATHYYKESDDAAATAYYNKDLETTFTFNDVGSLDENKLCFARTYEGARDDFAPFGTGVEISEERIFDGSKNAKFKIGIDPKDNGIYTYTIYGEDKAGNLLNVTELQYYVNDNEGQNHQLGCGVGSPYTTAPKAMDTVSPTATITYTPLKETHYYPEGETQVNAYYNKNFDAKFQFADTYGNGESTFGVDPAKLRYTQNITAEQDKVLPSDDTLEVSYSVTGTSEGDHYTFGAYGEDKAGNPLNVTENSTTSPTASNPYTAASQEAQQLNYHKVLDTVAPVATFQIVPAAKPAHPEMQTLGGKKRFYLNTQFTATYSIDEINYDNSKVKAWYGHSNPEDYLNSSVSADTSATANNGFSAPDKIRSFTSTLDGLYSFTLTGEDRAGNQITAGGQGTTLAGNPLESIENNKLTSYIITVDTVSPVLQAGIGDYYEAALRENAYSVSKNSPYRNERSATLTLTATDPSPKVIRYATTSTLGDSADGDLDALDSYNQGGSVLSLTKDFSGEQVFAVKALAVADLAGNVSTAPANVDGNVSNYIYLDVTPPTEDKLAPTVSLVAHESGQGRSVQGVDLYNSTVTVEAKISDPGFGEGAHGTGGTSSGLFTLHYVVQHNDSENWNAQMEGKVATTSTNHGITTGADGIVYYTESKKGDEYTSIDPGVANEALVGEDTITFTFDAATFNYNDISIRVWAEDNTGHKSGEAIYRFGIDTTAPKIQVTYDNNDARNEKYFKADRTATVVVTERNFDPDNTVITTEVGHSGWSYAAGGLANGDDDTWTCTVPYTEDADYTFNVTAKDLVGHDAGEADYGDSVAPKEFTVDKTKPVIEITFDNNDVRNGRYYKENRTATIHIEEHNFAAEDAEVTTTAEIAEGGVAAPAAGSWGSAGDSNTAQVPFNADGDYTMQVKFQDKAGNEAEPKEVELFTVDTTAPELTFSINDEAFEAGSYTPRAYNGQVVPGITYHDINYDGAGTQMSIVGAKNVNSQILSGAPAEDAMGGVYTCENIAETPENDDVYTCTGRVVDMAGNESTVDFLFSVNRYGSNYLLTPDTQALVDNYYTNSAPNLGVSEINVNTLKFEEITYALNGDIRTLQPGTDYQVTESGSETSWKQYDYTIFNSNFDREGVYDITIYSEDEAGNANSNHTERVKEYSKNISFVLDQTAPSITISGVDEGGIYDTDTRSVTVAYGENFAMDNLIITNGEKTETYTAEQLQATGGTLEFVVPASREKQSVKVTAADKAGNIATIESPRFVLSSSLFVRWVNNTPVMVGTISFGVLAVAAVADYLRKGFLFALLHKHTGVKH